MDWPDVLLIHCYTPKQVARFSLGHVWEGMGGTMDPAGLLAALGDCVLDALDSLGYPKV